MNAERVARYEVEYAISAYGDDSIVKTARTIVEAENPDDAGRVAVNWVHDNDVYADPRINPIVLILGVELQRNDGDADA